MQHNSHPADENAVPTPVAPEIGDNRRGRALIVLTISAGLLLPNTSAFADGEPAGKIVRLTKHVDANVSNGSVFQDPQPQGSAESLPSPSDVPAVQANAGSPVLPHTPKVVEVATGRIPESPLGSVTGETASNSAPATLPESPIATEVILPHTPVISESATAPSPAPTSPESSPYNAPEQTPPANDLATVLTRFPGSPEATNSPNTSPTQPLPTPTTAPNSAPAPSSPEPAPVVVLPHLPGSPQATNSTNSPDTAPTQPLPTPTTAPNSAPAPSSPEPAPVVVLPHLPGSPPIHETAPAPTTQAPAPAAETATVPKPESQPKAEQSDIVLAKTYAQKIIDMASDGSGRIAFQTAQERIDFQEIAATGRQTNCGGVAISPNLLKIMSDMATEDGYSYVIGVVDNGHVCDADAAHPGRLHPKGMAVDLNGVSKNGVSTGNSLHGNAGENSTLYDMSPPVLSLVEQFRSDFAKRISASGGGEVGQSECFAGAGNVYEPGVDYVGDPCNHLHVGVYSFSLNPNNAPSPAPAPAPETTAPAPATATTPPVTPHTPILPHAPAPPAVVPRSTEPNANAGPILPNLPGASSPPNNPPTTAPAPAPTSAAPETQPPAESSSDGMPEIAKTITQDVVAKMIPGASQDAIAEMYPLIMKSLAEDGIADENNVLNAFATINAETSNGKPIPENGKGNGRYGAFYGRGYIQLTWADNYKAAGNALGLDLYNNPDLALMPQNAARILAWYLASPDHQSRLSVAYQNNDLEAARRVVNGGTNGIDNYAAAWHIGTGLIH